nr:MAG TPA: hypothetical protein [Caudoviricetes sp.]
MLNPKKFWETIKNMLFWCRNIVKNMHKNITQFYIKITLLKIKQER